MSKRPRRAPTWLAYGTLSLGAHALVFGAMGRTPTPPLAFNPATQTLAGDTLSVEEVPPFDGPAETPSEPGEATSDAVGDPSQGRAPNASDRGSGVSGSRSHLRRGRDVGATSQAHPMLFGAVGERFATDLATTFTRAFAQAASADPAWATAPLGSAGSCVVTLTLDESGRIASTSTTGAPTDALRRGVERTMALVGSRSFTSTEPVTRLRLTARVTRDEAHDGLHGDVFALSGGSFSGAVGTAFFALPSASGPGRRVDVELRLVR